MHMGQIPRCAVLFALPADRRDFDRAARQEVWADYGRLLLGGRPPDQVWTEQYSRIVPAMGELTGAASHCGALIIKRATLADVGIASELCDVVIVVGHWRGWVVSENDFRSDVPTIVRTLHQRCRMVFSDRASAADLARDLTTCVENGSLLANYHRRLAHMAVHPSLRQTLGRDALDEILGELIAPGNRVELYDGLHTPCAFDAAIDGGFRGMIDLATCNSVALATVISMRRGAAVKVVHTLDLVDPWTCCVVLADTFRQLADGRGEYASARHQRAG
jgi:hypothetical protein